MKPTHDVVNLNSMAFLSRVSNKLGLMPLTPMDKKMDLRKKIAKQFNCNCITSHVAHNTCYIKQHTMIYEIKQITSNKASKS